MSTATRLREAALIGHTRPELSGLAQLMIEAAGELEGAAARLATVSDLATTAHRALDAAERAWHTYAAALDVGPDRTRAFDVFENVRNARRT